MYVVYVLFSEKNGNFYIGCTSDLQRRLNEHNSGQVKSTKSRRPLRLVYKEEFVSESEAFNKEKHYKGKAGIKFKKALRSMVAIVQR